MNQPITDRDLGIVITTNPSKFIPPQNMPSLDDATVYNSPKLEALRQLDPQKLRLMNQLHTQIIQMESTIAGLKHSLSELSAIFLNDAEPFENEQDL